MPSNEPGARTLRDAEITAAHADGESVRSIASRYGLSSGTVWKIIDRYRMTIVQDDGDADMAALIGKARRQLQMAIDDGLPVASVRVGIKEYPTWERTDPNEPAVTVEGRTRANEVVLKPTSVFGAEIRQATPVNVKVSNRVAPQAPPTDRAVAVIYGDQQWPFVDHAALDVCEQIQMWLQRHDRVDDVVWVGDNLDLPEFSKYLSPLSLLDSAQAGIDGYYRHMARVCALSPDARKVWIPGNHEQRLINWLIGNAPKLVGLRRADEESEPVLSLEFLCRTDELGVEMAAAYPEGEVWLNDSLRVKHGSYTGPNALAKELAEVEASTIFGHLHTLMSKTSVVARGPRGLRAYVAACAGGTYRIDGTVPSTRGAISATGKPALSRGETWLQGGCIVTYNPNGGELPAVELFGVVNGVATFRGRRFEARCDVDGNQLRDAA